MELRTGEVEREQTVLLEKANRIKRLFFLVDLKL